jgi:hypothetical protein
MACLSKVKLGDVQDGEGGEEINDPISNTVSGRRRTKEEMKEENQELFGRVLDLRAAGVQRRHRFDFAFTTDGVAARVQMRAAQKANDSPMTLPSGDLPTPVSSSPSIQNRSGA